MKKNIVVGKCRAFTLIEVIITIVVFAILGSLLVTIAGPNLYHSTVPVTTLSNQLLLQEQMEHINATYMSYVSETELFPEFKTYLNNYNGSHPDFSVTTPEDFDDGDPNLNGTGPNANMIKVQLQSNVLGASLVTIMVDNNNS